MDIRELRAEKEVTTIGAAGFVVMAYTPNGTYYMVAKKDAEGIPLASKIKDNALIVYDDLESYLVKFRKRYSDAFRVHVSVRTEAKVIFSHM